MTMTEKKPRAKKTTVTQPTTPAQDHPASAHKKPKKTVKQMVQEKSEVDNTLTPWLADTPEAKLCRAADQGTVRVKHAATRADLLEKVGLKLEDITPAMISKAEHLEHKWDEAFKERVARFNAKVDEINGVVRETTPTTGVTTTGEKTGGKRRESTTPKVKAPNVERDSFGSSVNSISFQMNAAITNDFRTPEEVAKASGVALARVKGHIKWLQARGLVEVGAELQVKRIPGAVKVTPAKKKSEIEYQIFEMPVTAVFRYAGKHKMDFQRTCLAVETITGKSIKDRDAVLQLHYNCGKTGNVKWGEIPELTDEQVEQLKAAGE